LNARPNPFHGRTELAGTRTGVCPASIWIQDVSGRRVRELVADGRKPGLANVVWDGRDAAGKDAPAGVYFALISTGGRTDETMVVKLK
jgi:flagellar hook assembly protein FlgD